MKSPLHTLKEISSFIASLIALTIIITIFAYMLYSLFYLVPHISDTYFAIPIYVVIPFPIWPTPVLIFYLTGSFGYAWYVFLASAISASVILMLFYGIIPYYRSFVKNPSAYRRNPFQELSELYALNIFFSILVVYIFLLFGYTPHTPGIGKMPIWQQMLSLLHASVYEELIVRTVFLGIPVYLFYILKGKRVSPIRILGGYGKITSVEAIFIVLSAIVFAAAHVSAWGFWKMIPTFVGGLLLGYLYIRYGIYASIMLHFMTDFISIPMGMEKGLSYLFGFLMLAMAILGLIFFISYTIRTINYFSKKKPVKRRPQENKRVPNVAWTNLVCPNCGGTIFQYVDKNTVRCIRCGTEIKVGEDNSYYQNYFN
ncbi:CAAX amino terminal protease family [Aciduliprofundum sp. MAR08-339]|uniref:CPBP family intramembrane glutamic endopeptidase n=1 Tax=Aciduliprofundum sp. (strain MAR08-339) TaxID=673860 RepID=UPI0002A4BD07|nr:CAAX amino terminal protease family [Aciduliprofundum sp. MAR08-339]